MRIILGFHPQTPSPTVILRAKARGTPASYASFRENPLNISKLLSYSKIYSISMFISFVIEIYYKISYFNLCSNIFSFFMMTHILNYLGYKIKFPNY